MQSQNKGKGRIVSVLHF